MHALTLIPLLFLLGFFLGIAGLLGLQVMLVVATIFAGRLFASPRPPQMRIGVVATLACWIEEIVAGVLIITVTMPLERFLVPRDRAAARPGRYPVLLVHGYINNAGAMFTLADELARQGHAVHTINLEPVHGDIGRHAPKLDARIRAILASGGSDKVVMVAHSMGGLAARAYFRAFPDAPVAQLITLGSPHQGTPSAYTAWGRAGKQMRPGSGWLAALEADEKQRAATHADGARWPCPLLSIYSYDDNIAFPQNCARIGGAREMAIAGVGHMSLPMSRRVAQLVCEEIVTPAQD